MYNEKTVDELMEEFGEENVRVMEDEVHVYGQMPNSIETGWWFYNYVD